jgi:hypothetical protein
MYAWVGAQLRTSRCPPFTSCMPRQPHMAFPFVNTTASSWYACRMKMAHSGRLSEELTARKCSRGVARRCLSESFTLCEFGKVGSCRCHSGGRWRLGIRSYKNYRPRWVRPPFPLGCSGGAGQGGYGLVQQGGCFARLLGVAWWEALLRVAPAWGGALREAPAECEEVVGWTGDLCRQIP